jgi:membrane protease YdiL (CAAX protease family)
MTYGKAAASTLPTKPTRLVPAGAPLGPLQAFGAFAVLLAGFLTFGPAAQGLDIVPGLWASEAITIALPVFLWTTAACVRPGPLLGLRPVSGKWIGITVVTALANQPVVTVLAYAAHRFLPAPLVMDFDRKTAFLESIFRHQFWPMTLTVVFAAPLGEELFFRGFAFPLLAWRDPKEQSALRSPLVAALVSGALFSFIHLDPVGFVGLMEIGVWLAVLRWGSGSLYAALLGHALNNAAAAISFVMGWQDPNDQPPLWVISLGLGLLVAFGVLGYRVLRRPSPAPPQQVLTEHGDGEVRHGRALALWLFWGACSLLGLARLVQLALAARH